jgi:hypothetical protein
MKFAGSADAKKEAKAVFEKMHLIQENFKLQKWRAQGELKDNREAARRLRFDHKMKEEKRKNLARIEKLKKQAKMRLEKEAAKNRKKNGGGQLELEARDPWFARS